MPKTEAVVYLIGMPVYPREAVYLWLTSLDINVANKTHLVENVRLFLLLKGFWSCPESGRANSGTTRDDLRVYSSINEKPIVDRNLVQFTPLRLLYSEVLLYWCPCAKQYKSGSICTTQSNYLSYNWCWDTELCTVYRLGCANCSCNDLFIQ